MLERIRSWFGKDEETESHTVNVRAASSASEAQQIDITNSDYVEFDERQGKYLITREFDGDMAETIKQSDKIQSLFDVEELANERIRISEKVTDGESAHVLNNVLNEMISDDDENVTVEM